MPAFRIVENFYVIENVLMGLNAGFVNFPPNPLCIEQVKEALHHSIIIAVTPAADASFQIMIS